MNIQIKWMLLISIFCILCFAFPLHAQTPGIGNSASAPGSGGLNSDTLRYQTKSKQLISLAPLFASPTPSEVDAVKADWASRTPACSGWQVEVEGVIDDFQVKIVSHSNSG
ncbi:MAG: hypothetical protein ABIK28_24460, partial [Planctomycetota bacterium]